MSPVPFGHGFLRRRRGCPKLGPGEARRCECVTEPKNDETLSIRGGRVAEGGGLLNRIGPIEEPEGPQTLVENLGWGPCLILPLGPQNTTITLQ